MVVLKQVRRLAKPVLKALFILSIVAAALSLLTWQSFVMAQAPIIRDYQVKATFLFQFPQFVEWPPEAFSGQTTPLVIGVLGEDPFGSYLDQTVRDETVASHPVAVQRFRRVEEIKNCHVLFVSRSEAGRLEEIVASLEGRNILTVSDAAEFAEMGGIIQFVTQENRIRLIVNVAAARLAGLTISSKLLRPATVINPVDPGAK